MCCDIGAKLTSLGAGPNSSAGRQQRAPLSASAHSQSAVAAYWSAASHGTGRARIAGPAPAAAPAGTCQHCICFAPRRPLRAQPQPLPTRSRSDPPEPGACVVAGLATIVRTAPAAATFAARPRAKMLPLFGSAQ